MLKRAWLVFALLWATVFIGNGLTKANGVGNLDVWIALAPLAVGWFVPIVMRYIVTGSVTRPKITVYGGERGTVLSSDAGSLAGKGDR